MRRVVFRPAGAVDLDCIVLYLSESSVSAAERFGDAVRATAEWLAKYPGAGHRVDLGDQKPDARRQYGVRGFPAYLMFYRHDGRRLIVVRVIHGARDLPRLR